MNTIGDLVAHATLMATRGPCYPGKRGSLMRWCWYCHRLVNIQCRDHARRPEWMPDRPGEPYWPWEQETAAMALHLSGCPDFGTWLASGNALKEEPDL